MTEMNGDQLHLEFMKRRGRRAPSDCGETLPTALNPAPYDIINGEVVQREYMDKFQGFEPHRPLNLFEKSTEDEGNMAFRRVRKTVSEPKIGSKPGRPKVPDILSKPRVPDELLNARFYDKDFWSTTSSVAGDTASFYTLGSIEDDFEDRFNLREQQDRGKNTMPKWCQDAFGKDEITGYSRGQHSRFEPPKESSAKNDAQKYYQTRTEPGRHNIQTKITGESPPKYEDPVHSYRKYNRQISDPPRLQRNLEQTYNTRRISDQGTFVFKDEGYSETRYERVSSSVSQAPVYKRVC